MLVDYIDYIDVFLVIKESRLEGCWDFSLLIMANDDVMLLHRRMILQIDELPYILRYIAPQLRQPIFCFTMLARNAALVRLPHDHRNGSYWLPLLWRWAVMIMKNL